MAFDPVAIAKAELEAEGLMPQPVAPVQAPAFDPLAIAKAELAAEDPVTYGGSVGQVIKDWASDLPSTLWEGAKALGNTGSRILSKTPIGLLVTGGEAFKEDLRNYQEGGIGGLLAPYEQDLRVIGGTAAGIGAAGLASTVGAPAVLAATVAPAVGSYVFNKANQLTGSDAPTTFAQDWRQGLQDTLTGALMYGAPKTLQKGGQLVKSGLNAVSEYMDDAATAARERAFGVQYGDKKAGLGRRALYTDDQGNIVPKDQATSVESSIQQQMDRVEADGFLKRAAKAGQSADDMAGQLAREQAAVGAEIQTLIGEADQRLGMQTPAPTWNKAQQYILQLERDNPALAVKMADELAKIETNYANSKATGLSRVNAVKRGINEEANIFAANKDTAKAKLYRAAYEDLMKLERETFDAVVPQKAGQLAQANDLYSAQSTLGKTLEKRVSRGEAGFLQQAMTPAGSAPYVGAGLLGSWLAPGVGTLLAPAAWLGRAYVKGKTSTQPVSVMGAFRAGSRIAGEGATLAEKVASALQAGATPAGVAGTVASGIGAQQPAQNEAASLLQPTAATTLNASDLERAMNEVKPKLQAQQQRADLDVTPSRVDPDLVEAVIWQESRGRANAVGPQTKYGRAKGLMQLLDTTGEEMFKKLRLEGQYNPFDAEQNRTIGTAYLKDLTNRYNGSVPLALAAYNWGMGNLERTLEKIERTGPAKLQSFLEKETSAGVADGLKEPVARRRAAARLIETYGFEAIKPYLPDETKDYVVKILGRYKQTTSGVVKA